MSVARVSRPPGFDMTYRPTTAVFGPPFAVRLPSFVYAFVAACFVALVLIAESSPSNTWLYVEIVEKDVRRLIGARTLAVVLVVSSLASIVRSSMRGVRVRGDGVEYRDVVSFGWPKVRRFRWAQIDCIILDSPSTISLDLWDGTRAFLPSVGDRAGLAATLEKVGAARAIPVRGGAGLDELPESADFDESWAIKSRRWVASKCVPCL